MAEVVRRTEAVEAARLAEVAHHIVAAEVVPAARVAAEVVTDNQRRNNT